jgi:hypothetical protein
MSDVVKGFLIVLVTTVVCIGISLLIFSATGDMDILWVILVGGIFGLLYGLEAGILLIYDLSSGIGWLELTADLTWSLPNTIFGFVFGNIIYIFFGTPSRNESKNKGWIVFVPNATSGFGVNVLQTLGTVNLGGTGAHEKVHLLQARIVGPLFLPIFAVNYVVNFIVQGLWTITVGMILWKTGLRNTPYFRPGSSSVVSGFFGWIYYATVFEIWAYATE